MCELHHDAADGDDVMCRGVDEDVLRREVEREYMTMKLDGTVLGVEDMANTALYVESDEARELSNCTESRLMLCSHQ